MEIQTTSYSPETSGTRILGAGGLLSQHLPGYEPRQPQVEMANLVGKTIRDEGDALIEAGTGTGKSMGYLIPAILANKRVVVSTETIALQGQLINKDLPRLAEMLSPLMNREITFAIAKGRGNYFCFAGDTQVITWDGTLPIRELAGSVQKIVDGNGVWTEARFSSYGVQEVYEITLSRDSVEKIILATAEHRWFTQGRDINSQKQEKATDELSKGDRLLWGGAAPICRGRMRPSPFGIAHGIVFGDGTIYATKHSNAGKVKLYGEKTELLQWFPNCHVEYQENGAEVYEIPNGFKDLPQLDESPSYLYGWLAGYFATDGSVSEDGVASLSSSSHENLKFVQSLCNRLGICTYAIRQRERKGYGDEASILFILPLDTKTLGDDFYLRKKHRDRITEKGRKRHLTGRRWTVVSVRRTNQREEVFCATVPSTHSFVLDGNILTGNCPRNAEEIAGTFDLGEDPKTDQGIAGARDDALFLLDEFRNDRWDGDKATLRDGEITDLRFSMLSGDDSCAGKDCPNASECPYLAAKALYANADVIVSNHRLYLMHSRLKVSRGVNILPDHLVWIADEAHTLADVLVDTWGAEIRHTSPTAFIKRLKRQLRTLRVRFTATDLDVEAVAACSQKFFDCFRYLPHREKLLKELDPALIEEAKVYASALVETLKPARKLLRRAAQEIALNEGAADPKTEGKLQAIDRLDNACQELMCGLLDVLELGEEDEFVRYMERDEFPGRGRDIAVTLHCKPIETARYFQQIRSNLDSAIYTSATLAVGGSNPWITPAREFGLDLRDCETFLAESPFNYPRQVRGYIPCPAPDTKNPEFHSQVAKELVGILNHTQGRAFILFSSHFDLKRVYELVASRVRFPLLMQGDLPKEQLIERFKETPNSVLFGCRTFWVGVDIPGESLSCVVIVKLPFPNPSSPLVAARCEAIEKRGGKPFFDYSLPYCIREVRQGFGRLIRTSTDTGLFAILDGKMHTARYARQVAAALPNFNCDDTL